MLRAVTLDAFGFSDSYILHGIMLRAVTLDAFGFSDSYILHGIMLRAVTLEDMFQWRCLDLWPFHAMAIS